MECKQCSYLENKLINIATSQLQRREKRSEVNQVKYFTLSRNTRNGTENEPNLIYYKTQKFDNEYVRGWQITIAINSTVLHDDFVIFDLALLFDENPVLT